MFISPTAAAAVAVVPLLRSWFVFLFCFFTSQLSYATYCFCRLFRRTVCNFNNNRCLLFSHFLINYPLLLLLYYFWSYRAPAFTLAYCGQSRLVLYLSLNVFLARSSFAVSILHRFSFYLHLQFFFLSLYFPPQTLYEWFAAVENELNEAKCTVCAYTWFSKFIYRNLQIATKSTKKLSKCMWKINDFSGIFKWNHISFESNKWMAFSIETVSHTHIHRDSNTLKLI